MRRNFVWAEGGPWLINPPLLHYVALELGRNARTSPDAWCYLRESYLPDRAGKGVRAVKNFERWLHQRDADGARTVPEEKVDVPEQMFEFAKTRRYEFTARRTDAAQGQTAIRFGVDDAFLSGGPRPVAVKVTYVDRGGAEWFLEYRAVGGKNGSRRIACGDTGATKTATFILRDAVFPGKGYRGEDMEIRAVKGDAVIRFVRIIKLDASSVAPALGPGSR
jgi:hypothetical protein